MAGRTTPGGMDDDRLRSALERQRKRDQGADRGPAAFFARTAYLGSIGIMLVLPVLIGAYLGNWLDRRATGFSFSWTVSLIVIGVFVGIANVVLFVRKTWS
jgi:ATP synthase protein I